MTNKVLFTSDTHFFHKNVIKYSNRPYRDLEEMHDDLIYGWNTVVGKHDTVYHLGDFFISDDIPAIDEILGQLNGRIRLVKGNHDGWVKKIDRLKNKNKIEWVKDYFEHSFKIDGAKQKIVLMHYPMHTWNQSHYGSWQLHGHCHGSIDDVNRKIFRLDVGVDSIYGVYTPIPLEDIAKLLGDSGLRDVSLHHPPRD